MAQPEYVICLECETPVYVFEWREGRVLDATCPVCGNEDPVSFATEEEMEEMDASGAAEEEGFEE
jgi:translation initiation factor 2 beta subunit (eIF-2beta)/eIF-5